MPGICDHEIYSATNVYITDKTMGAICGPGDARLVAVAMMSPGWLLALTTDGALVVMPYNPDKVARQFGLDQGAPICRPLEQHVPLAYRPYVAASSVTATVSRVIFVNPGRTWVGSCTPNWTGFWAKKFAYLRKYMMNSTSTIRLEHVNDTDRDLCLPKKKARQPWARGRLTPFHQKLVIWYCSTGTQSEDLPVSYDLSEHVLIIITAPLKGVIAHSRKRPHARLPSAGSKKARGVSSVCAVADIPIYSGLGDVSTVEASGKTTAEEAT
ncbi:hypothetical protein U1Q18_035582 [Sarracenia purpurea var. burkii]